MMMNHDDDNVNHDDDIEDDNAGADSVLECSD